MLPPQNRSTSASGDRPARPNGRRGSVGLPTTPGRWSYEVTSFSCELRFDHLSNEAMLVAQELHHFEGKNAGIAWVTGGSAACPHWQFNRNPLMMLTSSLLTKRDGILCHLACLPDFRSVSNDRLKFKHTFETGASPEGGDFAVFFCLSLFCYTAGLVFRRDKSPISHWWMGCLSDLQ